MFEALAFYIFAGLAILTALLVIFQRDPVRSAIFLVACFIQVAALFVLLRSPFLAAVQVFVYVGAVVVLFLFVIMVLELKKERLTEYLHTGQKPLVLLIIPALIGEMGYLVIEGKSRATLGPYSEEFLTKAGSTQSLGKVLFTKYIFSFEVVSLLLLVALMGAIILTMKREKE